MDAPGPVARGSWRIAVRIAATAWVILFLELALIRFLSGYVRVFAFYTNFVIIAAFLGMGAGMLRRHAAQHMRWTMPVILAALTGFAFWLAGTPIDVRPDALEWLWGADASPDGGRHVPLSVAVTGLFVLSAALFVPLGAMLGAAMATQRALPAYAADLAGSLLGVVSFGVVSALSLPPAAWFGTAALVWFALVVPSPRLVALSAAGFGVAVAAALSLGSRNEESWSPYYRITLEPHDLPGATTLNVNGALHQVMLDFRRSGESAELAAQRAGYERPYAHVGRIDTALVVGAGTGNDVAILLALGAKHVDAVEIDPDIVRIGRERHPMRPYDDPRVHVIVTDARAFLRAPPRRYDVITFGTLDSQTLLNGMTSVRLDNYVYTQQSFEAAKAALAPGGSVVMYHLSGLWFVSARLYQNLDKVFGAPPRVFTSATGLFNYTFITNAGSEIEAGGGAADALRMEGLRLSTDDWPFPYLRGRRIPAHYTVVLAAVLVIGLIFVGLAAGRTALLRPDWPMFLVGSGFLLIETKGITTISLHFGSTWTVNAAVIASILAVALVAALATDRGFAPSIRTSLAVLAVLLVASAFVPAATLVSMAPGMRWLVAVLYVGVPVLFASFLFSRAYGESANPTAALAFNILGAVSGGVLEYSSMTFGLNALNWLALGAYTTAVLMLYRRGARRGAPASLPA